MIKKSAAMAILARLIEQNPKHVEALAQAAVELVDLPAENVREIVPGKWEEKNIETDIKAVDEWQSARCSVCGKYHTTPYMYYFTDYNFCPHCGAQMQKVGTE